MASSRRKMMLMVPKARALSPKNVRQRKLSFSFITLAPPRQDPGPSRAAEEGSNSGQHNQFEEEPGHDPERERLGHQPAAEAARRFRVRLCRQQHEASDEQRRNQRDPYIEHSQKNAENRYHDTEDAKPLRPVSQPQSFGFDVDVEVGNDN